MRHINKIMVGLDLTEVDDMLIKYTKYLNMLLRPEHVHFVHIQKHLNIPDEIIARFPSLMETIDQNFVKEMVHETEGFNIVGTEIKHDVYEGLPLEGIQKRSMEENIDLLIIGRKDEIDSHGIVPQKLVRQVTSHVMLVPEKVNIPRIKKILVATDYSDYSRIALELAIEFAEKVDAEIICQHIYDVPLGYHKTGKTFQEFADIMKKHSIDKFEEFVSKVDANGVKISALHTLNDHTKFSEKIIGAAKDKNADLIVIGARGRTKAAALILGSIAEELITVDSQIPLLIAKNKEKSFNFWDAFNNL